MRPGPGRPADAEEQDEVTPDAADEEAEADDAAVAAMDTAAEAAENATDKIIFAALNCSGQHRKASLTGAHGPALP